MVRSEGEGGGRDSQTAAHTASVGHWRGFGVCGPLEGPLLSGEAKGGLEQRGGEMGLVLTGTRATTMRTDHRETRVGAGDPGAPGGDRRERGGEKWSDSGCVVEGSPPGDLLVTD